MIGYLVERFGVSVQRQQNYLKLLLTVRYSESS